MKNKPRLSICIATYNRSRYLAETLGSIIAQASDDIEIIVADGASPDDTQDVVLRHQASFPGLRYHRLPVKGGVDRDYCHAVSFASGDYCWLLTDDDTVKPGGIKAILAFLPLKYSLIVVNAEVRDKDMSKLLEAKHLHIDHDISYQPSSLERLFIDTAIYLSFIGAVVIDRELWNKRIKEAYIGTEFIHMGVIFQEELPNGSFVMSDPVISIRYGNAQWTPRQFEIWTIKWPELIWSFPNISDSAKARICMREPWKSTKALLLMRAYGAYSLVEYARFLSLRLDSRWRRIVAKAVAVFPGIVPNVMAILCYTFRAPNDFIIWHSLKTSPFNYRRYVKKLLQMWR